MTNFFPKKTILSIKIKQRDILSDSKNFSDLIAYLGLSRTTKCFVHCGGLTAPYSIGRIERRYESLQTYDTTILYILQNLINTDDIYSTNLTKTRNLPRAMYQIDLKLNALIFLPSIEIFLYLYHSLIRQLACSQVRQQLVSE